MVSGGLCDRVDSVTMLESADSTGYDSPETEIQVGFGRPIDDPALPAMVRDGTAVFEDAVWMVADGLGVELDEMRCEAEFAAAPEDVVMTSWTIPAGCVAGVSASWQGWVGDRKVIDLKVRWRKGAWLEPDWEIGDGYFVEIEGRPCVRTRVEILPPPDFVAKTFDDFMVLGMIMTAMPAIDAIPAVCAAAPGIVTYLDLPLIAPRGFVPAGLTKQAAELRAAERDHYPASVRQQTLRFGDSWARIAPWRGGGGAAHLVVGPDASVPPSVVEHCVEQARASGYESVLTERGQPARVGRVRRRRVLDPRASPPARARPRRNPRRRPRCRSRRRHAATARPCSKSTTRRSTASGGWGPSGSRTRSTATPASRFRVGRDDHRVVAYGITGVAGRYGYLQRVAVHPDARSRGWGHARRRRQPRLDLEARRAPRVRQHPAREPPRRSRCTSRSASRSSRRASASSAGRCDAGARSVAGRVLAAATLVAGAAMVAGAASPARAQTATPSFVLAGQSPWVAPGTGFVMRFQSANVPAGAEVALTVHDPLESRTAFDDSVNGGSLPPSRERTTFPFDALPTDPATGQRVLAYPTTGSPTAACTRSRSTCGARATIRWRTS